MAFIVVENNLKNSDDFRKTYLIKKFVEKLNSSTEIDIKQVLDYSLYPIVRTKEDLRIFIRELDRYDLKEIILNIKPRHITSRSEILFIILRRYILKTGIKNFLKDGELLLHSLECVLHYIKKQHYFGSSIKKFIRYLNKYLLKENYDRYVPMEAYGKFSEFITDILKTIGIIDDYANKPFNIVNNVNKIEFMKILINSEFNTVKELSTYLSLPNSDEIISLLPGKSYRKQIVNKILKSNSISKKKKVSLIKNPYISEEIKNTSIYQEHLLEMI